MSKLIGDRLNHFSPMYNRERIYSFLCGIPTTNISKYKNSRIMFEIPAQTMNNSENQIKEGGVKNLGPFKVRNCILINTIVEFRDCRTQNFKMNIILKKKNKIIDSKTLIKKNFNNYNYTLDFIQLKDMTIKIVSSVTWTLFVDRPLINFITATNVTCIDACNIRLIPIGKGSQGHVYRIEKDCTKYALKIINKVFDQSHSRELTLFLLMKHPNIIRMHGYSIFGCQLALVLEYADNLSLDKYIEEELN